MLKINHDVKYISNVQNSPYEMPIPSVEQAISLSYPYQQFMHQNIINDYNYSNSNLYYNHIHNNNYQNQLYYNNVYNSKISINQRQINNNCSFEKRNPIKTLKSQQSPKANLSLKFEDYMSAQQTNKFNEKTCNASVNHGHSFIGELEYPVMKPLKRNCYDQINDANKRCKLMQSEISSEQPFYNPHVNATSNNLHNQNICPISNPIKTSKIQEARIKPNCTNYQNSACDTKSNVLIGPPQSTQASLISNYDHETNSFKFEINLDIPILQPEIIKVPEKDKSDAIDRDVHEVMNSILSIFESLQTVEENETTVQLEELNLRKNNPGIFPNYVIASVFKIIVGDKTTPTGTK